MNKFFLVSEEELEEMILVAIAQGRCGLGYKPKKDFLEAKAACRARVVPDWATHFAQNVDGPFDYGLYQVEKEQEIKR